MAVVQPLPDLHFTSASGTVRSLRQEVPVLWQSVGGQKRTGSALFIFIVPVILVMVYAKDCR